MTVSLPEDLARRLAAQAARRGMSVGEVAAEPLAARLSTGSDDQDVDPLGASIGCGAWERAEPLDLRRARRDPAERKLAQTEGA